MPLSEAKTEGVVWKSKKTVYESDGASCEWYFSVKEQPLGNGCKESRLDKCLFRW